MNPNPAEGNPRPRTAAPSHSVTTPTRIPPGRAGPPAPDRCRPGHRAAAAGALLALLLSAPLASPAARTLAPSPEEMDLARRFMAARFAAPPAPDPAPAESKPVAGPQPGDPAPETPDPLFAFEPPFSFTCGGRASAEFLRTWTTERSVRNPAPHRTAHTVTWTDPAGALSIRAEAVAYDDFPVVEWTLFFRNPGITNSPLLENIRSLDVRWQRGAAGEFLLHHNVGAPADGSDYSPLETVLGRKASLRLAGAAGRSTGASLSYFNLERAKTEGLIVVVGWPGQWSADFERDADRGMRLRAGQELTRFRLRPGEEVRTPLSVLQFWKGGDWIRAQCLWRRWMTAHNLPRPGGQPPPPMLLAYLGGAYEEMYRATEEAHFLWFNRYLEERIPLDYWWMDAGWYPCDPVGWPKVGTWEVDRRRFPRGLRAISDLVHSKGMKTLLWFEPERVAEGSWLAENKPDWVHGGRKGGLLNLGRPEVRDWVIERVDKVLNEEGIDLYRQDFNIEPLPFWRRADTEDRQGITEIQHVTQLLAFWDEIRRRHPDMLLDACASGGRRNDLEMMRRAVPLWRSDKTMEPHGQQSMTYGLALWLPFFGTGTVAWGDAAYFITGKSPVESYGFWSSACPSLNLLFDVRERGLDYEKIRRLTAEWRLVMPCYYGDFYPLTSPGRQSDVWLAWQFDRPEQEEGVVQVFRRAASPYESARLPLRGLDPGGRYRFTRFEQEGTMDFAGETLLGPGLPVTLPTRPAAAVLRYRRLP